MRSRSVAIIGFGRFGQLLSVILSPEYEVKVVEVDPKRRAIATRQGYKSIAFEELAHQPVIFICVPISSFAEIISDLQPLVHSDQLVMDVCSVKQYPAKLMAQLKSCQTIATHPLFGPDSAKNGLEGLKLVICPIQVSDQNSKQWIGFWRRQGVEVIQSTPEEHDRSMIYSLGFTYLIGQLVNDMNIPKLPFKTKSFEKLESVAQTVGSDSTTLLRDMLLFNPYLEEMRLKFQDSVGASIDTLSQVAESPKT